MTKENNMSLDFILAGSYFVTMVYLAILSMTN